MVPGGVPFDEGHAAVQLTPMLLDHGHVRHVVIGPDGPQGGPAGLLPEPIKCIVANHSDLSSPQSLSSLCPGMARLIALRSATPGACHLFQRRATRNDRACHY